MSSTYTSLNKTGEMGTLMWYSESNHLFDATLGRLRDHLCEVDFRGDIAINCFVDRDTVYPIEATARFGCPSTYLQSALHHTPWTELLYAVADGRHCDLKVRKDYAIGLTLAVPPFPYGGKQISGVSSAGLPMLLRRPLTADETRRLHLEGVALLQDKDSEGSKRSVLTHSLGYAVFVTGTGATVEAAQQAAYELAGNIVIPKVMYRTDIGNRFLRGDEKRLREYGWI
jgi:phosphoribosylamine--glycine ligase